VACGQLVFDWLMPACIVLQLRLQESCRVELELYRRVWSSDESWNHNAVVNLVLTFSPTLGGKDPGERHTWWSTRAKKNFFVLTIGYFGDSVWVSGFIGWPGAVSRRGYRGLVSSPFFNNGSTFNADIQGTTTLDGDSPSHCDLTRSSAVTPVSRRLRVFNCDQSIPEPHSFSSLHSSEYIR